MKDPGTYFYQVALDMHGSFNAENLRLDSVVGSDDIVAFRGVCRVDLDQWPNPVLIAFDGSAIDYPDDDEGNGRASEPETDAAARQLKALVQLRKGLAKIGLEELACYDQSPPGYALVAQLTNPDDDLAKAARELTKLVWKLAE